MAKQKLPSIIFGEEDLVGFEFLGVASNPKFVHLILKTTDNTQFIFNIKTKKDDKGETFIPFKKHIIYNKDGGTALYFKSKPCGTALTDEFNPCVMGSNSFIRSLETGITSYVAAINSVTSRKVESC